jgi:glycosyltransferase involved in cell wall biosynthesis
MTRKKVLWLCSWYPNRIDPFDGDFIQRHARAASLYENIHVLRVVADTTARPGSVNIDVTGETNLTEQIVYLGKGKGLAGRLFFFFRRNRLCKQLLKKYLAEEGPPALVHVHVPYPAGRFAVWLKHKTGIPYVVTEHWTIYQPGNLVPYEHLSKHIRRTILQVLKEAAIFLPVSADLGKLVARLVINRPQQVLRNVVDTSVFFYPVERKEIVNKVFRFIHVSGMNEQKNPAGLLRAFAAAYRIDPEMELLMVGNRDQSMKNYAATLGLPEGVIYFDGEIPYKEVAVKMQESDALVLFSVVENAPCVISEALCCGLPVVATRIGGIPEMLDGQNGMMVTAGDEEALKNALLHLKQNAGKYNRAEIASTATTLYNYQAVGMEIAAIYKKVTG